MHINALFGQPDICFTQKVVLIMIYRTVAYPMICISCIFYVDQKMSARHGGERMVVWFTCDQCLSPVPLLGIYSIPIFVIKFVSVSWQVDCIFSINKNDHHHISLKTILHCVKHPYCTINDNIILITIIFITSKLITSTCFFKGVWDIYQLSYCLIECNISIYYTLHD